MPLTDYTVIYGGSFNPPHIGHTIACTWLIEALNAYEVHILPTYKHVFGKELAPFMDRIMMCDSLEQPWTNGSVQVRMEEELMPQPNLTINLVKHYLEFMTDKVAVAIGSDLVGQLGHWEGWDEVAELTKIVMIGREGTRLDDCKYSVMRFPIKMPSVSSTDIRNRLKKGDSITGLVPAGVEEYIRVKGLYK